MTLSRMLLFVLLSVSTFVRCQSTDAGSQHMRTPNVEVENFMARVDATGPSNQYTYTSVLSSSLIWPAWTEAATSFEVINQDTVSSLPGLKAFSFTAAECQVFEQSVNSHLKALLGIAAHVYLNRTIQPSISYTALAAPKSLYTKAKLGTGEIELDDSVAQGCNVPYEILKYSLQTHGIVDESCVPNEGPSPNNYFTQFKNAATEADLPPIPTRCISGGSSGDIKGVMVGMKLGSLINIVDLTALKMFLTRLGAIAGVVKYTGGTYRGIILGWTSNDKLIVATPNGPNGAYVRQTLDAITLAQGTFEIRGTVIFYEGNKTPPTRSDPPTQNVKQNKHL